MRIAAVHDYLTQRGGAVKRLLAQGWPVAQLQSQADRNETALSRDYGRSYSSSEPTCRLAGRHFSSGSRRPIHHLDA